MSPIVLIPARLASTRLPDKPLADIAGFPMIVHVWRRAMEADVGPVVVAAAEQAIADAVTAAGGQAVLTDPDLPSGSDRINQALSRLDQDGQYDIIVNVQGDLPTLDSAAINHAVGALKTSQADISTLVTEIREDHEREDPGVVKAIVAWDDAVRKGRALYFTLSLIHISEPTRPY